LALRQRRHAMTDVPVVDEGRDEDGIERDGAQELPRYSRNLLIAIFGNLPHLTGGPFGGVMAFAALGGRQSRDEPIRRGRERHVGGMMVDAPGVDAAGDVPTRRGDDETALGADIDAGAERRLPSELDLIFGDDV